MGFAELLHIMIDCRSRFEKGEDLRRLAVRSYLPVVSSGLGTHASQGLEAQDII